MYKNILVTTDGSECSERSTATPWSWRSFSAQNHGCYRHAAAPIFDRRSVVYPEDPERYQQMTDAQAKAALNVVAKAAELLACLASSSKSKARNPTKASSDGRGQRL